MQSLFLLRSAADQLYGNQELWPVVRFHVYDWLHMKSLDYPLSSDTALGDFFVLCAYLFTSFLSSLPHLTLSGTTPSFDRGI